MDSSISAGAFLLVVVGSCYVRYPDIHIFKRKRIRGVVFDVYRGADGDPDHPDTNPIIECDFAVAQCTSARYRFVPRPFPASAMEFTGNRACRYKK